MSAGPDVFNLVACDEDTSDDDEFSQHPVLVVPPIGKDEDLSGPPMDGFEYLKRVV